ncbi:hypothetical protein [Streptomyces sp. NPDC102462]|uniref:hypothetical protein n=1 Tax=Streptomyces sp. NPDC102462 TaxID=3366178 RepID=UPI0038117805
MNPAFANAVEMLPMPRTEFTAAQLDGTACPWCARPPEIPLGPRLRVAEGRLDRWFPHSCLPCAQREAARVHAVHVTVCPRCTHRDYCMDARALRRLALAP